MPSRPTPATPRTPLRLLPIFVLACVPTFAVDVWLGAEISPWALYLVPVVGAGWLCGKRAGLLAALFATVLIALAALLGGHPFDSWWHFALSLANRGCSLLVAGGLAAVCSRVSLLQSIVDSYERETG